MNNSGDYGKYFSNTERSHGRKTTSFSPMLSFTMAMMLCGEVEGYLPLWYVKKMLGLNDGEYEKFVWYIHEGKPGYSEAFKIWTEGRKSNEAMRYICEQNPSASNDTTIERAYLPSLEKAAKFYNKICKGKAIYDEDTLRDMLGTKIVQAKKKEVHAWPPHYPGEPLVLEIAWDDLAIDRIPLSVLTGKAKDSPAHHFSYSGGSVSKCICYSTLLDDGRVVAINYPDVKNQDPNCQRGITIICFSKPIREKKPSIRSVHWKFDEHARGNEMIDDALKYTFRARDLHYAHWI
jgi:hypothetical protein